MKKSHQQNAVCNSSSDKIPVSVIIVTRNEQERIKSALECLQDFSEIIVVDSASTDKTQAIAKSCGAKVVLFSWNGRYPKKRQWCLDNLEIKNDWVFFIDADEQAPKDLCEEIRALGLWCNKTHAGYFIKGLYKMGPKILRRGFANNKLALINRHKMHFPLMDDLDCPGMGEIEGHYQPVRKREFENHKIGRLKTPLIHDACADMQKWHERHERYARWETEMDRKNAWPQETTLWRALIKKTFKAMPARGWVAFIHAYVLKGGFLEGAQGYELAKLRKSYYERIKALKRSTPVS